MRLWHYKLLPVLPKQQLLSQLRECVAIAKDIYTTGKTNHILINPIMDYPLTHFNAYCSNVITEMDKRGYNVSARTLLKLHEYVGSYIFIGEPFPNWHNDEYLTICMWNLYEKYLRGGIPQEEWDRILITMEGGLKSEY